MRSESEVAAFKSEAAVRVRNCKVCDGSAENIECVCVRKWHFEVEAYEACIPRAFWYTKTSEITVNQTVFKKYVKKYVQKLSLAHKEGYGMVLFGSNGVGKSTFACYVAANAIRKGKTAYYTTMPQLDHDLKKGFEDNEIKERLEVMLTSDFLILDEMSKEFHKELDRPTWFKTEFERILKMRYDESRPVIMATNAAPSALETMYGPAFASMTSGKYQVIPMAPGDIRPTLRKKMKEDMYG